MGKDRSIVPYWGTYPTNRVRGIIRLSEDGNRTAGSRAQPEHRLQKGGFPTPVRPDDSHQLPLSNGKGDASERLHFLVADTEVLHFQRVHVAASRKASAILCKLSR
jgi:hypothetical protein